VRIENLYISSTKNKQMKHLHEAMTIQNATTYRHHQPAAEESTHISHPSAAALRSTRISSWPVVSESDLIREFVVELYARLKSESLTRDSLECLLDVDCISSARFKV
jgi:hypothetical protein